VASVFHRNNSLLHSGYVSEHLPDNLRSTGMGVAISVAGLGSALWGWGADHFYTVDPVQQSPMPFYSAAALGIIGCVGLFVFDRIHPIRQS